MKTDEESFVILGSTPTPSMELIGNSIASNDLASALLERSTRTLCDSVIVDPWKKEMSPSSMNELNKSITASTNTEQPFSLLQITNGEPFGTSMVTSETSMAKSNDNNMFSSTHSNLADSILLGKIDTNTIKNVSNNFPSLCTPQSNPNDIIKLENLMSEHVQLKENLQKTNLAMKQHFFTIDKWQSEFAQLKCKQNEKVQKYEEFINKQKEKISQQEEKIKTLSKGITDHAEACRINVDEVNAENSRLVKEISHAKSIIENLKNHIEKISNGENLPSFVLVEKSMDKPLTSLISEEKLQNSLETSVSSSPKQPSSLHQSLELNHYQRALLEANEKLTHAEIEKAKLQDMEEIYLDQVNCLQVNLTATEELLKKTTNELDTIRVTMANASTEHDKVVDELKADNEALKNQLDVYRTDFEAERLARQDIAGEREQILADLQLLQRRNQQLIEQVQSSYKNVSGNTITASEEVAIGGEMFTCPICKMQYKQLNKLEEHLLSCLKD